MIVFIDGHFGAGKTTTANLLVERLPNAMLYDPEEVGMLLFRMLSPIHKVDDFQDYNLWPKLVVEFAGRVAEEYGRDLVVPMTITDQSRFERVTSGLRHIDPDFHAFRLTVSQDELRRRILARPASWGGSDGGYEWCLSRIEGGLEAMEDPAFGTKIPTDERMPDEVAAEILSVVGFEETHRTASSAK